MHRRRWTPTENRRLLRLVGKKSLADIASKHGRTSGAVLQRIGRTQKPDYLISVRDFAVRIGVCKSAAARFVAGKDFCITYYRRNQATTQVDVNRFWFWLADPINWVDLDVNKIVEPDWVELVQRVNASDADRYFTLAEAGDYAGYSIHGMGKLVRSGRLESRRGSLGRKGVSLYLVRKSDLDAFLKAL